MPPVTGILESSLYVGDLARSAEFYERVFGLARMTEDDRFCALGVAGRQVLLLFNRGQSLEPMPTSGGVIPPHDGHGQLHLAFSCAAETLADWEAHLARQRVPIESRVEWERGGTSIYIRDPDGHLIELATPGIWPVY